MGKTYTREQRQHARRVRKQMVFASAFEEERHLTGREASVKAIRIAEMRRKPAI